MIISRANTPEWYQHYDRIFGKEKKEPEKLIRYIVKFWSEEDEHWVRKTNPKTLFYAIVHEDLLKQKNLKTKIFEDLIEIHKDKNVHHKREITEEEKENARKRGLI